MNKKNELYDEFDKEEDYESEIQYQTENKKKTKFRKAKWRDIEIAKEKLRAQRDRTDYSEYYF